MKDDTEMAHANKKVGQQEAERKRKNDVYSFMILSKTKRDSVFYNWIIWSRVIYKQWQAENKSLSSPLLHPKQTLHKVMAPVTY